MKRANTITGTIRVGIQNIATNIVVPWNQFVMQSYLEFCGQFWAFHERSGWARWNLALIEKNVLSRDTRKSFLS